MEREACKVCCHYFKMFAACPTVLMDEFWDKPFEFFISFYMAMASANQVYDVILMLYIHRKNYMNLGKFKNLQ